MRILESINETLHFMGKWLPGMLRLMALRFDRSPFESVAMLEMFVRTRSSYIAQTSLFGYLKARMGTRFRVLFEDDVFSHAIRVAAARLFGSCLADLTIYSVSLCRDSGGLTEPEATALAAHLYDLGLEQGLAGFPDKDDDVRNEATARFRQRLAFLDWDQADDISITFSSSEADLVRFAPVVDEFKELDREIVMNSIRFRWRDIREQLRKRLQGGSVAADWSGRSRPPVVQDPLPAG